MNIHSETKTSTGSQPAHKRIQAADGEASILLHASGMDPDMRYFGRGAAMDPYLAFSVNQHKVAVVPNHEYDLMRRTSGFDEVLSLPDMRKQAAAAHSRDGSELGDGELLKHLADCYGISEFRVGSKFPSKTLIALQQAGMAVQVDSHDQLFPQRICKTPSEVEAIRKANLASTAGFEVVARTLAEATIGDDGMLNHGDQVLTAEHLRDLIRHACLEHGAMAMQTIVAAGDQACENHCEGYGPIPAHQLIVVDIFPQRIDDGYWGDMTRTFLKGRASDEQRRLVDAVKQGHQLAIDDIKHGACAGEVHRQVQAHFESLGYSTQTDGDVRNGFFHALGHGLGLEVHENPVLRATSQEDLHEGMVITIEPGLYYPGLGGVRIEDVVLVTSEGSQMLSKAPYQWEIA